MEHTVKWEKDVSVPEPMNATLLGKKENFADIIKLRISR